MKSPDEILKALEVCGENEYKCSTECPYLHDDGELCHAYEDAAALIRQLQDVNRALRTELATNHIGDANKKAPDQDAKSDAGKPRLTLVPPRIIWDIAAVREYGTAKYGDPENWRKVSAQRYKDAAFRHFMAYLATPNIPDEESGLPHLWHLACNVAFLCALEDSKD